MGDRDIIDLRDYARIIACFKYRLIGIILAAAIFASGIGCFLPKQYESSTVIQMNVKKENTVFFSSDISALAMMLGRQTTVNAQQQNYTEMIKSRPVLEQALAELDIPDKDINFIKKRLRVQITKGTDFIQITGIGRSPGEAQQIAENVRKSFQQFVNKKKQAEQLGMNKFLEGQLEIAKQELEQTQRKLDEFSKVEKGVEYISLKQRASVAQEVYGNLIKKYKEVAIQNAMDNSGMEVIEEAGLSNQPTEPKLGLILALGVAMGVLIDFVYVIYLYRKKYVALSSGDRNLIRK